MRLKLTEYLLKSKEDQKLISTDIKNAYLEKAKDGFSSSITYRKVHLEGKFEYRLVQFVISRDPELGKRSNNKTKWVNRELDSSSYIH